MHLFFIAKDVGYPQHPKSASCPPRPGGWKGRLHLLSTIRVYISRSICACRTMKTPSDKTLNTRER